jgi:hypothetical protein
MSYLLFDSEKFWPNTLSNSAADTDMIANDVE